MKKSALHQEHEDEGYGDIRSNVCMRGCITYCTRNLLVEGDNAVRAVVRYDIGMRYDNDCMNIDMNDYHLFSSSQVYSATFYARDNSSIR